MEEKEGQMVINDATRIKETLPTLAVADRARARKSSSPPISAGPRASASLPCRLRPVADESGRTARRARWRLWTIASAKKSRKPWRRSSRAIFCCWKMSAITTRRRPTTPRSRRSWRAWRMSMSMTPLARPIAPMPRRKAWRGSSPSAAASARPDLLMERELKFLGEELENPARPFVVILGGAKVSDKIKVIDRLLEKADTILIGGAMAYTFKLAQGFKVGKSLVRTGQEGLGPRRAGKSQEAQRPISSADGQLIATPVNTGKLNKKGKPVFEFAKSAHQQPAGHSRRRGRLGHRAGHRRALRRNHLVEAKTILWNGPMGMFEDARFADGTNAVARAVAEATAKNGAKSIIGGGDSVKALNKAGLGDKVTFMSTGGGASLEFLEGKVLPGVAALIDK